MTQLHENADADKESENELLAMSKVSNNMSEVSNCLRYNIIFHIHDIYSIIVNL